MASIPTKVQINEEGPREGFQIEKGNIPTARKIELIDSLSQTGLNRIQIVSFVNPKAVPGMADAEEVVEGFAARIVQHECEHLTGHVFIDNVSAIRRQLNKGKLNSIIKGTVRCSYRAKAVGK